VKQVSNVSTTIKSRRKASKTLGGVHGYIAQSSLPATLVDLVYLRVSQINKCAYCLDMHTRDLLRKGQSVEKLALVQAW
jgi:AhpD family alkylhydroperoxidase